MLVEHKDNLSPIYFDGVRAHSLTSELCSLAVRMQPLLEQSGIQTPLSLIHAQVIGQVRTLQDLTDTSLLLHRLSTHFHEADRERRFAQRFSQCPPAGQILWRLKSVLIRF